MTDTTVTNQIIQTLEYLFEKFGIAVNWSTETVLPAVQALMVRYARYEIVCACIWIAIALFVLLAFTLTLKKAYADYKKPEKAETTPFWIVNYDGSRWEMSTLFITVIVAGIIASFIAVICIASNAFIIASWVCIPEVEFAKEVAHLIECM